MIAMKIFRFVEVAILSHRHEEIDGFFKVLREDRKLAALAQIVACLPLVQQVRGSIPGGVINFHLTIFNLDARRGGDVHFLITRLYITVLD